MPNGIAGLPSEVLQKPAEHDEAIFGPEVEFVDQPIFSGQFGARSRGRTNLERLKELAKGFLLRTNPGRKIPVHRRGNRPRIELLIEVDENVGSNSSNDQDSGKNECGGEEDHLQSPSGRNGW